MPDRDRPGPAGPPDYGAEPPVGDEAVIDETTIWASPGVVADDTRADLGQVATLTVTFAVTVHTADRHPGAEPVDAVLAVLLGRGFDLLTGYDPAVLVALPIVDRWAAHVDQTRQSLDIRAVEEMFYSGDLGAAAPAGWFDAVARRGLLVVLAASEVNLFGSDRTEQIRRAQQAGRAVAAQVPVHLAGDVARPRW